jgi:murein DD-endopeptidase MepM/ murein hydrolase activator NlpD
MGKMRESIKSTIKRYLLALKRTALFTGHVGKSLLTFKKPVIKQRYLKTRDGKLRARYIVTSIVGLCLMTASLDFSGVNTGHMLIAERDVIDAPHKIALGNEKLNNVEPAAAHSFGMHDLRENMLAFSDKTAAGVVAPKLPDTPKKVELPQKWQAVVTLEKGGTLSGLLTKNEVGGGDAYQSIKAMSEHFDPRDMKPGQNIILHYSRGQDGATNFDGMDVIKSGIETIEVRRAAEFGFESKQHMKEVYTETRAARVVVSSSIYADLSKQGVPDGIINQLIKSYSWAIDFQRDIWGGEEIEVLYTVKVTKDESYLRSDNLLYANLASKGTERPIYHFTKKDGDEDYYNDEGSSVRKALLKTPVDGARISSTFGKRKHPVLGYTKMHKGLDFAAPSGTPIYAAGKGVIERANRFSSFGNYVKIRHNDKYQTAYAHLKGFARGIKKGVHVKQGQVIGYVGTTGRSTGPHLHYEVHVNGKAVNPQSVDLPIGETLSGTNLANFKIRKEKLDKMFNEAISKAKLIQVTTTADDIANEAIEAETISH